MELNNKQKGLIDWSRIATGLLLTTILAISGFLVTKVLKIDDIVLKNLIGVETSRNVFAEEIIEVRKELFKLQSQINKYHNTTADELIKNIDTKDNDKVGSKDIPKFTLTEAKLDKFEEDYTKIIQRKYGEKWDDFAKRSMKESSDMKWGYSGSISTKEWNPTKNYSTKE